MIHLLRPIRLLNHLLLTMLLMVTAVACTSERAPEVYAVVSDGEAGIWAGTKDGLYHKGDGDGMFRQLPLPSISHHPFPAVYALCCDTLNSRLWIGAWNHLYCYDLARQRFIVTRDSSIYETVGLMCDSVGRIRAFTGHGLYRFTLSDSLPGGELTEPLDSVSYHKHEYAKIDATGWTFEKNNGNGGLLPWLIALILAAGIVVMLFVKRRGKSLTPNSLTPGPSPKEYSQGRNAGTDATTPLSNRRGAGGEATFLERAQKVVNAHISDEDFNADVFAREMAVSRAQLFRKLKAANGQTPKDFIDERRMAYAVQLLQTTNDTQAVIAMKVGYSDASNFHRAFIHQFGMTPSEYVKQQKNQIVTPDSQ